MLERELKDGITDLINLFEDSYINEQEELILCPRTNLYFLLGNVNTIEDLCYKIIAWCSRDCCKTEPYHSELENKRYREYIRNNINEFLGIDYSEEKWLDLYSEFGNGIHEEDCRKFIKTEILFEKI